MWWVRVAILGIHVFRCFVYGEKERYREIERERETESLIETKAMDSVRPARM